MRAGTFDPARGGRTMRNEGGREFVGRSREAGSVYSLDLYAPFKLFFPPCEIHYKMMTRPNTTADRCNTAERVGDARKTQR